MSDSNRVRLRLGISLLLALATLAVYWPARHYGFVTYDDPSYVYENPPVQRGLTGAGVWWAFTTRHNSHWHPLTWLSLMADATLHGTDAGGYHLTNLLLHTANAVLTFLVLAAFTGAVWPSAWVAALFALHPLHVESVAWVTERKDVLSGLFGLLTLGAYRCYVRSRSAAWYATLLLCFALGLMAKSMLVTLPWVLLLLDHWPLRRGAGESWWRLVREKIPLFLLAAGAAALALWAGLKAKITYADVTFGQQLANAVVAYAAYLFKMIWPTALACFYPHPGQWPVATVMGSGLLLAGVTAVAVAVWRRVPAVAVGWCWYLGTLVPVIGFIQVGNQAFADRYTYLPLLGAWIALAWGLMAGTAHRRASRVVLAILAVATVAGSAWLTTRQLPTWRNSLALFQHAVTVTKHNAFAHYGLGLTLRLAGRHPDAIREYREALRIKPDYPEAHNNLGQALAETGAVAEAATHFRQALRFQPDYPSAHYNLGLAHTLAGRPSDAIHHFQEALRLKPDFAAVHSPLAMALHRTDQLAAAITQYEQALQHQLNAPDDLINLARLRATAADPALRDGAAATRLAERAVELTGGRIPYFLDTLAAAYAAAGRWPEAVATAEQAIALARAQNQGPFAAEIQSRLDRYRAGQPWHEPSPPAP